MVDATIRFDTVQKGQELILAKARLAMFQEMDPDEDYVKNQDEYLTRTAAWYAAELALGTLVLVLAWKGEELIAWAHLRLEDRPPHPAYLGNCHGHVSGVYVLPSYRSQGLGLALMEKLHGLGRSLGVKRLHLHSSAMATKLYQNLGYIKRNNALSLDLD